MIYVYQLPDKLSDGYCFGGGRPISFLNVDWFNDHPEMTLGDVQGWVRQKSYFTQSPLGTQFLILCKTRPGLTSVIAHG